MCLCGARKVAGLLLGGLRTLSTLGGPFPASSRGGHRWRWLRRVRCHVLQCVMVWQYLEARATLLVLGVLAYWLLMGFGSDCADGTGGATNGRVRDFTHPSPSCRAARRRDPALRGICRTSRARWRLRIRCAVLGVREPPQERVTAVRLSAFAGVGAESAKECGEVALSFVVGAVGHRSFSLFP